MGAGDDSELYQQRRIEDLLQQAMALDLGFAEADVLHAINHLVQVYGSVEEAYAWIPRDNFTVLVEHILDNTEMAIQQSLSMACGDLSSHDLRKASPIRESGNKPSKRHLIKKKMLLNKCETPGIAKQICHDSSNITPCGRNAYHSKDDNLPDHCISRYVPSYQNKTQSHFKKKISTSPQVLEGPGYSNSQLPQKMDLESRKDKAKIQRNASEVKSQKPDADSAIVISDEHESTQSLCIASGKCKTMHQRLYKGTVNKRVEKGIGSCHDDQVKYFNTQDDPLPVQHSVRRAGLEKGKLSCLEVMPQDEPEARMLLSNGCKDLASRPQDFSQQCMHSNSNGCNKIPHMPENKLNPSYGIANGCGTLKKASSYTLLEVNDVHEDRSCIGLEPPTAANFEMDSSHKQRNGSEGLKRIKSKVEIHTFMTSDDYCCGNKDAIKANIMICGVDACTQPVEAKAGSKSIVKTGKEQFCGNLDMVVTNDLREVHGVLDCVDDSLLEKLESSLEEGDCERAFELFAAWKSTLNVETIDTAGNRLLWEERSSNVMVPGFLVSRDISRGLEDMPIPCVNEYTSEVLPEDFLYIRGSIISAAAHVDTSFSRIGDLHCTCLGDCLSSSEACKCTDSTRGEYAYDANGCLIPRLATNFQSGYATENGDFITECCAKCHCSRTCGNRVVQRGITNKLQVFMTPTKKGWGVRALEKIPARSFVFEYIGEITTNEEQYYHNLEHEKKGVHSYTMNLDADYDMEQRHFNEGLTDSEALVLDATNFGNVSRFLNHRCNDANLFMRPVQIETRDTHYYHAAFFALHDIEEMEELTWDYGIDFNDSTHTVKAFKCYCNSPLCRDKSKKQKTSKALVVK